MTIIREEIIGDCRLIQGDCLKVVSFLGKFDRLITDPPYGTDTNGTGYGRDGRSILNDSNTMAFEFGVRLSWTHIPEGLGAIFYSARNTPDIMRALPANEYYGEIIWNKKAPGMGGELRYQHENIALLKRGDVRLAKPCFSIVTHYRDAEEHPHQKPVGVMREVAEILGGNSILDPFMGSGTTGVACVKLGRKFTGIELDPDYFDIACERIQKAYDQPDMFVEAEKQPEPKQEAFNV